MNLAELLYQKSLEDLKALAQVAQECRGLSRKEEFIQCLFRLLTQAPSLRQLWGRLDTPSQKAVAAAYYNGGFFDQTAFVAQYGQLPPRPQTRSWRPQTILLDLFIHNEHLPDELIPLLTELVPPQDKFQLQGSTETPKVVRTPGGNRLELIEVETEQIGLHDLSVYLHLVAQNNLNIGNYGGETTLGGYRKLVDQLLVGDFFPLPDKYRSSQIIRPFGLDHFARGAKLVSYNHRANQLELTEAGRTFYQSQDPQVLLEGFIEWTETGRFDELSRVSAIKGQKSNRTLLTEPHTRREAVIEALSWCPTHVWISLEDFYRAVKIWHFDFKVETLSYGSNLYVGYKEYGMMDKDTYWFVVKGSYINVVLWEYLGSIGALDLLYTYPELADFKLYAQNLYYDEPLISMYDGLKYFRINSLGAYLLGQAREYTPSHPPGQAIYKVAADGQVTVVRPELFTPIHQSQLALVAVPVAENRYQLDNRQILSSIEAGNEWQHLLSYLSSYHQEALPPEVYRRFNRLEQNSQLFKMGSSALFVKVKSAELAEMVMADPTLQKFSSRLDARTLVIPASKEKVFRSRLKELEYLVL